jgi:branched-chain amino acid transport system ATP-binding protein
VLEYGTKISDGTPSSVKNDPKVVAAYLGVDEDEASKMIAAPTDVKMNAGAAAPLALASKLDATSTKSKVQTSAKPKLVAKSKVVAIVKDDLKRIKGIGPVNEGKLNRHGVKTFAQIAAWKKADIIEAEAYLEFDGRIARESWVSQAKVLARQSAKTVTKGRK